MGVRRPPGSDLCRLSSERSGSSALFQEPEEGERSGGRRDSEEESGGRPELQGGGEPETAVGERETRRRGGRPAGPAGKRELECSVLHRCRSSSSSEEKRFRLLSACSSSLLREGPEPAVLKPAPSCGVPQVHSQQIFGKMEKYPEKIWKQQSCGWMKVRLWR